MSDAAARALLAVAALGLAGCPRSPPPSQFPTARAALDRMRATYACSRGVGGEAKIDYFDERGRVRGNLLFLAMRPEQIRFSVFSPFGVMLSTLTSDGRHFALYDLSTRRFLEGPANACNVARFTRVPVPPHALVGLMAGEAPVLVHAPAAASVGWESGAYVIRLSGRHQATQEIRLEPADADWEKPWAEQRVRVLEVSVAQAGVELYRAELKDHAPARTAAPLEDEDGLGPPIPPSGPPCDAEVPHRLRLEVPDTEQDVVIAYEKGEKDGVHHNPPLLGGVFAQEPPGGVAIEHAACEGP
jgi:hypothetical protein